MDCLVIIDEDLYCNQNFLQQLKENFDVRIELQTEIDNSCVENSQNVLYISNHFEGDLFEQLVAQKKPIISDLVVQTCITQKTKLPLPKHPLFNYFMKDFVICFSIVDKRQTYIINRYLNLIRFMGGQSRRDMKSGKSYDRTHLIDSSTDSDNYKLARIYGIPVLHKEWIDFLWENRNNVDFNASDEQHLARYRLKSMTNLKITLYNFDAEQSNELTQAIKENDGFVVPLDDSSCTHMVIKNAKTIDYIDLLEHLTNLPRHVVSETWLENSLQTGLRDDEDTFKLKVPMLEHVNSVTPTKENSITHQTLTSFVLSPNFDNSIDDTAAVDKSELKKQAITQELYQTEKNYVTILKNIIKVFREPLKNHQMPGQFPNEIELKTIFGSLPPIIEVHEKILAELEEVVTNWKAENEVGKIFVKHSKDFLTVYPHYVNYYEKTQEMIQECTEKYSKFAKFIKAGQTLPECQKQTLQELIINPIQRLPRIEMYLRALLNKTDNLHPDYKLLNDALNTIVSVNSEINQKKRKIEGQLEMFDILNDIEDCPVTLISAKRQFISKLDVKLIIGCENGMIVQKSDNLYSLLLFNDQILFCKKKTVKRTNSLRDRTTTFTSTVMKKSKKTYKYMEKLDLSMIKYIVSEFDDYDHFSESEDYFALIVYPLQGDRFKTYPFVVKDTEGANKRKFIDQLFEAGLLYQKSDFILKRDNLKSLDFGHAKSITHSAHKLSVLKLTRDKITQINRTLSVRRQSHMQSSISMENLHASVAASPVRSSKRISRVFTNFNFLTPKENDVRSPSRISRKMSSIHDLTAEENENFSLPTTPAPRKKKYQEPIVTESVTVTQSVSDQ